jgi:mono/diheme cytochrome c family protein
MRSTSKAIVLTTAFAAAALFVAAAETPFTFPPETARLKPGTGVELASSQCVLCHSVDYISTQPRLSAAQWRAAVVKMQTKYGAPIATNNVDALVDYLATTYGSGGVKNTPPLAK